MKKLIAILIGLAMVTLGSVAMAEDKIAVLDINRAIQNTDVAQQRISELRATADYTALRAELDSIDAELKKMEEDAQKNSVTWDQAKQQAFAKKRDYQLADRKLVIEKLQTEDRALSQQIMQELGARAQKALQELIEVEGIGLVLNGQGVIHADSTFDITAKLTDRINKTK